MVVDVASKHADNVGAQYGVQSMPTCFVLEQGVQSKSKKNIRPAAVKDITRLLEQEGGSAFQSLLKQRKEEASLLRQERISQNYAYATAYPYWWDSGWYPYARGYGTGWGFWAGC